MTSINPFIQTTTTTATSFVVSCRSLILFTSASFSVDTFDINNVLLNRQIVTMTPEVYVQWNNDDTFVNNWVAGVLGFVIPTPPVDPVSQP
jgi:hypothetical protein